MYYNSVNNNNINININSNKVISRWNLLYQLTVDASSINILKSRLACFRDSRMGFFMDYPLSPRPHWLVDLLVGLHKVNHNIK